MSKSDKNRTGSRNDAPSETLAPEWVSFRERLMSVLSKMGKDQYLVINANTGNRYIQFACQGDGGMRVEVSSNRFLRGKDRLTRLQTSWLRAKGWNGPTRNRAQRSPEKDPNESPNFFVDLRTSGDIGDIARLALETLVLGLKMPSPSLLTYKAFDADGRDLRFEGLVLDAVVEEKQQTEEERIYEAMGADPEIRDDDVLNDEVFQYMKYRGEKPEDLPDPKDREEYAAWLENKP